MKLFQIVILLPTVSKSFLLTPQRCSRLSFQNHYPTNSPTTIHSTIQITNITPPTTAPTRQPNTNYSIDTRQQQQNNHVLPAPETPLQSEFHSMITSFSSHTPYSVARVTNTRYRSLFSCVTAVAGEPNVYRAFLILFEDLPPLRIAGRMIFKHLTSVMKEETTKRKETEQADLRYVGVSESEEEMCWTVFEALSGGREVLEVDALRRFGLEREGWDGQETIDFKAFVTGVYAVGSRRDVSSLLLSTLESMSLSSDVTFSSEGHRRTDAKKQKHHRKYDHMVETFKVWEEYVFPALGEGVEHENSRMEDVLKGCFVGARNPQVVDALRIVYTDFRALRVAGDLIFKLMSKLVGTK